MDCSCIYYYYALIILLNSSRSFQQSVKDECPATAIVDLGPIDQNNFKNDKLKSETVRLLRRDITSSTSLENNWENPKRLNTSHEKNYSKSELSGKTKNIEISQHPNQSVIETSNKSIQNSEVKSVEENLEKFNNVSRFTERRFYPLDAVWEGKGHLFGCPCQFAPCIALCCPLNNILSEKGCVNYNESVISVLPNLFDSPIFEKVKDIRNDFHVYVSDPCNGGQKYSLSPHEYEDDIYKILPNGSAWQPVASEIINQDSYCLAIVNSTDYVEYNIILCLDQEIVNEIPLSVPIGMIVSVPFLLVTFIVYTIVPELKNMHGLTLRGYVGPLSVSYTLLALLQMSSMDFLKSTCTIIGLTIYFSFLLSFFWLNVMCFDIWWTFGGFRSLHGSVKQRERKKFFMYSVYAWGSASVLTGICMVMDLTPNLPDYIIRPKFGEQTCWFKDKLAMLVYFYGPMGVTFIVNICFFVSTTLKILQHKKDTAQHLKGHDSRRHDDNKQFALYLKLFIVMGINWSMEIISWLCGDEPRFIWYITDGINAIQGLIIFIIFVLKKKIIRLVMKRLGCINNNFLSRESTRSVYHSSTSRTCTTSVALNEKSNRYVNPSDRIKPVKDDSVGA